jgi:TetR/AcrR family transcriptional repressor of lmrAB and yxaGH operons
MARTTTARTDAIEAAARLFDRNGYHGAGLAEILEAGGSPRGSFYFHFPGGKQQLAVAAVSDAGMGIAQGIELMLEAHEDVAEAVGAVVDLIAADLERSDFRRGCPIAAVTHDTAARSDEIRAACREAFEHWRELLEARLRRGGFTRARAREEALVILAAIEGGITLGRAARDTDALAAVARRCRASL